MLALANISNDYVRFGTSLVPALTGGDGDLKRFVYSEGGFSFHSEVFPMGSDHVPDDPRGMYWPRAQEEMSGNGTGSPKWVMIRNSTHKLVYRPLGISELYDFLVDPRELNNVIDDASYAELKQDLMVRLMTWMVQTSDVPVLRQDRRGLPNYPAKISCDALLQPDPTGAAKSFLDINGVEES